MKSIRSDIVISIIVMVWGLIHIIAFNDVLGYFWILGGLIAYVLARVNELAEVVRKGGDTRWTKIKLARQLNGVRFVKRKLN